MNEREQAPFDKAHPKTCASDDFWSQVKRTVNGKPVGEDQIGLIIDAILSGLSIAPDDILLDLCCGNGALSDRTFARCLGGLGIDSSEQLIEVARQNFETPQRAYVLSDAEAFLRITADTGRFTKALCYGAFQYLRNAENVLILLRKRMPQVGRLFIGNLPDKARMADFLKNRPDARLDPDDPQSAIGIWRTEAEFAALAQRAGWQVKFNRMPKQFYAAEYRFDAVLTRPDHA